jgi:hypothetical protein
MLFRLFNIPDSAAVRAAAVTSLPFRKKDAVRRETGKLEEFPRLTVNSALVPQTMLKWIIFDVLSFDR